MNKILGAAADELSLDELYEFGFEVADNIYTLRIGLGKFQFPGIPLLYKAGAEPIQIGFGVQGEKGVKRIELNSWDEIMEELMSIFAGYVQKGDEVVLALNTLSYCNDIEMLMTLNQNPVFQLRFMNFLKI